METTNKVEAFLTQYDDQISRNAMILRQVIMATLPDIIEQLDIPAKMIAYCYGQKYSELICTIIPSKKGLKLGFNWGTTLPDPDHLLEGYGKISRYVAIKSEEQIKSNAIKNLLLNVLKIYKQKASTIK